MARTTSVPCRRDLACYRNDGHPGECAYPTADTEPRPVAADEWDRLRESLDAALWDLEGPNASHPELRARYRRAVMDALADIRAGVSPSTERRYLPKPDPARWPDHADMSVDER